jgi:hypothetical protein
MMNVKVGALLGARVCWHGTSAALCYVINSDMLRIMPFWLMVYVSAREGERCNNLYIASAECAS